jgi:hypothetical protein
MTIESMTFADNQTMIKRLCRQLSSTGHNRNPYRSWGSFCNLLQAKLWAGCRCHPTTNIARERPLALSTALELYRDILTPIANETQQREGVAHIVAMPLPSGRLTITLTYHPPE